jgi:hypothetical protein
MEGFSEVAERGMWKQQMVALVVGTAEEQEDNIRVCLVAGFIAVASVLAPVFDEVMPLFLPFFKSLLLPFFKFLLLPFFKFLLLPLFKSLATDKSLRIRFKVVESIAEIGKTVKSDVVRTEILQHYCALF